MPAPEISRRAKDALLSSLLAAVVLAAVAAVAAPAFPGAGGGRVARGERSDDARAAGDEREIAAKVDAARGEVGAEPSSWTRVVRRTTLALAGTIPSLEELRGLEALPEGERADAWLAALLREPRCQDLLAERLARALVGTTDGAFVRFRRRRFVAWLAAALGERQPFDAIVAEAISARGLWTDTPAASFLTQEAPDDAPRGVVPAVLTARVARAVLGKRIDCAECHDHPFASFTRADFRGLAAFFATTQVTGRGVQDVGSTDALSRVPFEAELLPTAGEPRARLAAWATRTRAFPRAIVNRVWSWMLGAPIVEPVDDVGDVVPAELELLADDFVAHGHDLARLVRVIARSRAFRSEAFPTTRLAADEVARSLLQSGSLSPRARKGPLLRAFDFLRVGEMSKRFGERGDDDAADPGTIAQRLLVMNADESLLDDAVSQVAAASTDMAAVDAAFLVVLTRHPSVAERLRFEARLRGTRGDERRRRVADLFAALISSTEASWNL